MHPNPFRALEEPDNDERDHSTSTASYVPDQREFPVASVEASNEVKKTKMHRIQRKPQEARRRELHELKQTVKYIMSDEKPLRNDAETSSPPPPPVASDQERVSRRPGRKVRFAPRDDCDCCDGDHAEANKPQFIPLEWTEEERQQQQQHRGLEELIRARPKPVYKEENLEGVKMIPPVPVGAPRSVARPFLTLGEFVKQYGADVLDKKRTPAKAGSSADSPLAADEPGGADYKHDDNPRVGTGETHQSAKDEDLDLLGSRDGVYTFKNVFGSASIATPSGMEIDASQLFILREKRGALNPVGEPQWEKLTLTVDSGASDTVVPPSVCPAAKLLTTGEKFGIEYEIADGSTVENMGEKHCLMKSQEKGDDAGWEMKFQVVDVSKALLSVHKVCEQGHAVLFTNAPSGSAILVNGDSKSRIPIRHTGGTYELDVWVKPGQGFGRPR